MAQIKQLESSQDMKRFLNLPWELPVHDRAWVGPLQIQVKQMLDTKKHPFYRHADHCFFIAEDSKGKSQGRLGVFVDHSHNKFHSENVAFFGFFECVNDQSVAQELFEKAKTWAKSKGVTALRGPFNLNTNYETGLLVEGFDDIPAVGMPYNPPYYEKLLLNCGFEKLKDILSYTISDDHNEGPPAKIMRHLERLKAKENITFRSLNKNKFDEEVSQAFEIYNDAWETNWGFIPVDEEEFRFISKDMKEIMDPRLIFFAEVNGEPAAFACALPDVNQVIRKVKKGKLLPFGVLKLLWGLKGPGSKKRINRLRIVTLGVKKKFEALGLGALLYAEYFKTGKKLGYDIGDCSWILEDNIKMNRSLKMMGAQPYKRHRIYELGL